MEHLAIWFEDTTREPSRVAPQEPAQGLPVAALADFVPTCPGVEVFAYRLAAPGVLSAVCLVVPEPDAEAFDPSMDGPAQLLALARHHGTIAWIRPYNEAAYKTGWDEGTELFPGHTNGPLTVGPLPGNEHATPRFSAQDLSLTLAVLDELQSPRSELPEALAVRPTREPDARLQRVVAQVVAHTAEDGNMVPWSHAATALDRVMARQALVTVDTSVEAEVSPARRHYELRVIHEGLGKMDLMTGGVILTSVLAFGSLPAAVALGAGWMVWRQFLERRMNQSPRVRARLLKALGHEDPTDTSPSSPKRVRPSQVNSPRVLVPWVQKHPNGPALMAWMLAWWPLHDALVTAQRRPPLSLDHPSRWTAMTQAALLADLHDPLQRPLSPALQQAAHRYREAMAPWLSQEATLLAQWTDVLSALGNVPPAA